MPTSTRRTAVSAEGEIRPDDGGALGLPRAAAGALAAREVDGAQVPDAGLRHGAAAARPVGGDPAVRLHASAKGAPAHWLLLIVGDRVDVLESRVEALMHGQPDNPITETGVLAESSARPSARASGSTAPTSSINRSICCCGRHPISRLRAESTCLRKARPGKYARCADRTRPAVRKLWRAGRT